METESAIEKAKEESESTLATIDEEESETPSTSSPLVDEEDGDENKTPYKTVEYKKKRKERSSPGEPNNFKKQNSRDDDIVADLYREMGLQRFLEI